MAITTTPYEIMNKETQLYKDGCIIDSLRKDVDREISSAEDYLSILKNLKSSINSNRKRKVNNGKTSSLRAYGVSPTIYTTTIKVTKKKKAVKPRKKAVRA